MEVERDGLDYAIVEKNGALTLAASVRCRQILIADYFKATSGTVSSGSVNSKGLLFIQNANAAWRRWSK